MKFKWDFKEPTWLFCFMKKKENKMFVYFKQDLKRKITYVGNINTMAIGYVNGIHTISDIAPDEKIKELNDKMAEELMKEGLCK